MTAIRDLQLEVTLGKRSYPILIGDGLIARIEEIAAVIASAKAVVITNDTLWPLYGETFHARLQASGITAIKVVLPDGELHKDGATLNLIYDALLEHTCDRDTVLIALGGGVIGDMAGFAAATYQRGVPFIQIPTTLLAQVDSSVGGKTAINHPRGKNMIGAFYQPKLVVIDTATLATLPDREYRSGLAEIIKYGAALDAAFFAWLEANIGKLNARDASALQYAIKRSCEIKAKVVAEDEFERDKHGGRAILNFGHTFGHAIEIALGYGAWLHGEAVACGMAIATRFSVSHGLIDQQSANRIIALIDQAKLPITHPNIPPLVMLEHMSRDKKNAEGGIRLILLDAIGRAHIDGSIGHAVIEQFLHAEPKV